MALLAAAGIAALPAAPANAQVAGSLTLSSSEMFRGESLSDADPALSASVSLDTASGLFAGASASVAAGKAKPRFNALVQYVGYARQLGKVSTEVGVIHRSYHRIVDIDYRRGFFEGFVGVGVRGLKARVYVSPDYLVDGRTTYYAEANARLLKIREWTVEGHFGLSLIPHDLGSGRHGLRNYEDWRLQASRPLGPVFVSVGINATNYPVYSTTGRARVFGSISRAF